MAYGYANSVYPWYAYHSSFNKVVNGVGSFYSGWSVARTVTI